MQIMYDLCLEEKANSLLVCQSHCDEYQSLAITLIVARVVKGWVKNCFLL